MAEVIPTDVSNYSRKESGAVSITQTEWSKLAKFLEVPVEEIYEEEETKIIIENPVFNDSRDLLSMLTTAVTIVMLQISAMS